MSVSIRRLDPRRFIALLETLHAGSGVEDDPRRFGLRAGIVLLTVAVCLLMLHYLKYLSAFYTTLEWLAPWLELSPGELVSAVRRHPYGELFAQAWWGGWHVVTYVLIPVLVLKLFLGDRVRDMGLGLGSLARHWGWYVLLASPILLFVVLASFRTEFLDYYPFYRQAHLSWLDLLAWEFIYLLQFVCLEFFFRGFFIQALRPVFGVNAVFVMCVPYLMIHFPKPWLEATGAILFGLFLGVLAMRSRSIWGGVAVHVTIAAAMDIAALIQGPGLPKTLLRF